MRIFSKPVLVRFLVGHREATGAVMRWYREASAAVWESHHDVKAYSASVSVIDAERVVFNVGGNKYRLVAALVYHRQWVFIKFIGTHRQYDAVDVATVEPELP